MNCQLVYDRTNRGTVRGPSTYNMFQTANKGKGWKPSRMRTEYIKWATNEKPKYDTKIINTLSGPVLDVRPAAGVYSTNAYMKQLQPVKALVVPDAFYEEKVDMSKAIVNGTFVEGFMGADPVTIRSKLIRNDKAKASSATDGKCFETNNNERIRADSYKVFNRLHANRYWMKNRQLKAKKYEIWMCKLNEAYDFDDKRIFNKLNRIIKDQKLNPSEREGSSNFATLSQCTGEKCYWDGTSCVKPTLDQFIASFPQSFWTNMNQWQRADFKQAAKNAIESGRVDLPAFFTKMGNSFHFTDARGNEQYVPAPEVEDPLSHNLFGQASAPDQETTRPSAVNPELFQQNPVTPGPIRQLNFATIFTAAKPILEQNYKNVQASGQKAKTAFEPVRTALKKFDERKEEDSALQTELDNVQHQFEDIRISTNNTLHELNDTLTESGRALDEDTIAQSVAKAESACREFETKFLALTERIEQNIVSPVNEENNENVKYFNEFSPVKLGGLVDTVIAYEQTAIKAFDTLRKKFNDARSVGLNLPAMVSPSPAMNRDRFAVA